MRTRRLSAALLAGLAAGCASAGKPHAAVDLAPAREAVEQARQAGAPEKAPEPYARAEGHLKEAEKLAGSTRAEEVGQAGTFAQLAQAEAVCAVTVAGLARDAAPAVAVAPTREPDHTSAQLRKA